MNDIQKDQNLNILNDNELKSISGGQPSEDTGFWYDVAYLVTLKIIAGPNPTAWATAVRKY